MTAKSAEAGTWSALVALVSVAALIIGLVGGVAGGAFADEHDEDDGLGLGGPSEETVEVEVEREAYWTNAFVEALPDIVFSEFPPGTACVLVPELCGELTDPITEPVDEFREQLLDGLEGVDLPAQPVAPGTLPAARTSGTPRYASALAFVLPTVPDGMEISRFELVFSEQQPTFSINSPAFRQAVLAAMVAIDRGRADPGAGLAAFVEEFEKIASDSEQHPLVDFTDLRVEACPATEPFEEGPNQEWETIPSLDCIDGATGQRNDEDGTWRFNLTFAAQSWADGFADNHGIVMRPLTAPNLAFGDPDISDFAQIAFGGGDSLEPPLAIIEFSPIPDDSAAPPADDPPPADDFDTGPPPPPADGGPMITPAQPFEAPEDGVAPPPDTGPAPEAAPPSEGAVQAAVPHADTPWYAWLALIAGLAALGVLGHVLTAEPALVAERKGAMSRLVEQRANGGGTVTKHA